jgi:hypothetical protein
VLDGGATAVDRLDNRQKRHVKTQHLVFGVVRNPDDLVGMQTWVEGVQDAPRATDTEVQLQVPVAVPGQCRHAVAERQIHAVQGIGHLARACRQVFVGVAMDIAFDPAGDDFSLAVVPIRKIDQG